MRNRNRMIRIAIAAALAAGMVSGCAGYPLGPSGPAAQPARAASPMSGYFTGARYYGVLQDQNVIEDRRGNGPVTVAPKCEKAERRAAVQAQWVAARSAPDQPSQEGYGLASAPLPSSDVDDE